MRTNKIGALVTLTALLALVCLASPLAGANPPAEQGVRVAAAVSPLLQYQGRLLDPPSGEPVADGEYPMTFSIYDLESGGTALWTEIKAVEVGNGLFNTVLGEMVVLDQTIFSGQALWLGVKVGLDLEATPRQPILPVAYALGLVPGAIIDGDLTINGALVGGSHSHDDRYYTEGESNARFAGISHNHTGADIVDGSIGTADLADSAVTASKIAAGAVTADKLAAGVSPKFISINPYRVLLSNDADFNGGKNQYAGVRLPATSAGYPGFTVGFTIPPDYTPGTPLSLRLIWHTSSTSCGLELPSNAVSFGRAGRTHIQGPGPSDGIEAVGGTVLTAPATANQSSAKDFTMTSPVDGVDLEPGDSFILGLYRCGDCAEDTCADVLVIQSISVTYE